MLPLVAEINELEPRMKALSDDELRGKTAEFKAAAGERRRPRRHPVPRPSPSAARPAGASVGMRHFDVQLIGGIVLHRGRIAEMRTGEGKTLVATLPAYLNALDGQGRPRRHRQRLPRPPRRRVDGADLPLPRPHRRRDPARHDRRRAARRDLRLRHHLRHQQRVRLRLPARQHEVPTSRRTVQRPLHFAIVDEVDSILIDEARTPLIISGPSEESTDKYYRSTGSSRAVRENHERESPPATTRSTRRRAPAALTDEGIEKVERAARRRATSTTPRTSS